jgi:hypothetical protein
MQIIGAISEPNAVVSVHGRNNPILRDGVPHTQVLPGNPQLQCLARPRLQSARLFKVSELQDRCINRGSTGELNIELRHCSARTRPGIPDVNGYIKCNIEECRVTSLNEEVKLANVSHASDLWYVLLVLHLQEVRAFADWSSQQDTGT